MKTRLHMILYNQFPKQDATESWMAVANQLVKASLWSRGLRLEPMSSGLPYQISQWPDNENLSLANLRTVQTAAGWITTTGGSRGQWEGRGDAKGFILKVLGDREANSCKNNLEPNFQLKSPS